MEEKRMLGDFIYRLRKEKNLSQAELGDLVGVSNKAVSKWETGEANPEIGLLKPLAEALGVTADELLACERAPESEKPQTSRFFRQMGDVVRTENSYEFISKVKTKKGLPYLHVCFGRDENGKLKKAHGVMAIGIVAKGIVSMGVVSVGLVSLGVVAIGLLALGLVCLGLVAAVGGVAAGLVAAVGGVAVGAVAVGGVAVGVLSVGGLSVGVWAHTGEFGRAIGLYTYYHTDSARRALSFAFSSLR